MDLFQFIQNSPTAIQAAESCKEMMKEQGGIELFEDEPWNLEKGQLYYVGRNDSALICFEIPENAKDFRIYACHGDSPSFKIKEKPELFSAGYQKLNVERYGGAILSTWLDRPLSVAGRVLLEKDGEILSVPVHYDGDLLTIPNVAVHMNRKINDGYVYQLNQDFFPLYSSDSGADFSDFLSEISGVSREEILSYDLFLYVREEPKKFGSRGEFILSPRLDDLACAYAGAEGFLNGNRKEHIGIFAIFDNEEVGSQSIQGAGGTFLPDVIRRIFSALRLSEEEQAAFYRRSFLLSADNGHAVHPNHPEYADGTNAPVLNKGILLKYNSSLKYVTDGYSAAFVKSLAAVSDVPVQTYFNRSDIAGGSTLGNIVLGKLPLPAADIGIPQLAMHSAVETCGAYDVMSMRKFAEKYFD